MTTEPRSGRPINLSLEIRLSMHLPATEELRIGARLIARYSSGAAGQIRRRSPSVAERLQAAYDGVRAGWRSLA
jgi:hypothetical protein